VELLLSIRFRPGFDRNHGVPCLRHGSRGGSFPNFKSHLGPVGRAVPVMETAIPPLQNALRFAVADRNQKLYPSQVWPDEADSWNIEMEKPELTDVENDGI